MDIRHKLKALAANMWWSWNPDALDLFRRLNPAAFASAGRNPLVALRSANPEVLADDRFGVDVDEVYDRFQAYLTAEPAPHVAGAPRTSYFCMEYGLHESLPIYSGGLGILAGDHAKAASDLGIPFTAVGLFLKEGYFQQHFTHDGWQQETYPLLNPADHAVTLVTDASGAPVKVSVLVGTRSLSIRAWRIELGRTRMYLLDTDFDANPEDLRTLSRRLYQGERLTRIQQEIILGIGGLRMLRALSIEADVYHMNEGHCAFLALELLREHLAAGNSREEAEAMVREQAVFTTHTPVMAGHDRFEPHLFAEQMAGMREQLGMTEHEMLSYGRVNPGDERESFTMTVLGLKLSRRANGVSRLNGEVARQQWHELFPGRAVSEVPIGHITNGVHLPTWTAPTGRKFIVRQLGDWAENRGNASFWNGIDNISDEELWAYRCGLRKELIDYVRTRLPNQTLPQKAFLNPDALTIGFARRFATYKRAPLLFSDIEQAIDLFSQADRPLQIVYAGKAHPADEGGKRFIQQIFELSRHPVFAGKVVFLENYNMEIGRWLISGCDVWLNNPRRPMEASGTSGQKIAAHGGLNLSILDGWWPEGHDGHNGWAIGYDASSEIREPHQQDLEDAGFLYDMLRNQVIPAFYERDEHHLPRRWISFVRNAMRTLPHQFSAARMVNDYVEQMYRVTSPIEE